MSQTPQLDSLRTIFQFLSDRVRHLRPPWPKISRKRHEGVYARDLPSLEYRLYSHNHFTQPQFPLELQPARSASAAPNPMAKNLPKRQMDPEFHSQNTRHSMQQSRVQSRGTCLPPRSSVKKTGGLRRSASPPCISNQIFMVVSVALLVPLSTARPSKDKSKWI